MRQRRRAGRRATLKAERKMERRVLRAWQDLQKPQLLQLQV
jgi:hypothetical protein